MNADLLDTALDVAEVAVSCVYAEWLDRNKHAEPKYTWAEVAFGVGYTLAFSTLRGMYRGGGWRAQQARVVRDFALSSIPIVIGELAQSKDSDKELAELNRKYPAP